MKLRKSPAQGTFGPHMAAAFARAVLIIFILGFILWSWEGARLLGQYLNSQGG